MSRRIVARCRNGRISPHADVLAMHRRQMERLNDAQREKRREAARRGHRNRRRPHVHDRGAILPNGERGCWRCWVSERLGVRP